MLLIFQSIRIWAVASKECKAELNDHDHVVECIAWAPENSHQLINESVGNEVRILDRYITMLVAVIVSLICSEISCSEILFAFSTLFGTVINEYKG